MAARHLLHGSQGPSLNFSSDYVIADNTCSFLRGSTRRRRARRGGMGPCSYCALRATTCCPCGEPYCDPVCQRRHRKQHKDSCAHRLVRHWVDACMRRALAAADQAAPGLTTAACLNRIPTIGLDPESGSGHNAGSGNGDQPPKNVNRKMA